MSSDTAASTRPRYADLPDGSAAGIWGPDDQLGCLNLLTPERTAEAARTLVQTGRTYSLNASLLWPNPPFAAELSSRTPPQHVVIRRPTTRDEYFNDFYPQSGSQWDGFLHVMDPETRSFYNGNTDESIGIEVWARAGITGRGALLDLARWAEDQGEPIDWLSSRTLGVAELEACAQSQGTTIEEGTVLLLRFGWQSGWDAASWEQRVEISRSPTRCPGVEGTVEMAERLWDWGVAAVGADNFAFEAYPFGPHWLHVDLLAKLGVPIGEFWALDELAAACAQDGRYEFLFASAPLNVPGGVGSTANALAIR